MPVLALAAPEGTAITSESFTDGALTISEGGSYYLSENVTGNITISSGIDVTLDLNGYVLKGTGSGSVITNNGTLTITDSNSDSRTAYFTYNSDTAWVYIAGPTAEQTAGAVDFENMENEGVTLTSGETVIAVSGGCITGGTFTSSTCYDTGIYNASGATLNLGGGYVIGNGRCNPGKGYSIYGGGICNFGTVVMAGGAVCGNSITGDTGTYYDNAGGGIFNEGELTISAGSVCYNVASSAVDKSHYGDGGGIYNEGTLTISGTAEISNNTADFGGGVFVYSGTFTMTGGTVTGNTAYSGSGGGVCNSGSFNMAGGSIAGNTAAYGGGICNYPGGTLVMSETAEISNNTAQHGGGVYQCGAMTIGGTAVITGNTKLSESGEDTGDADNLLVVTGYTVTIGTKTGDTEETKGNGVAALAEGAIIGVNIVDYYDKRTSGVITSNGATTDLPYFTSDDEAYTVKYNTGGYLELVSTSEIPSAVSAAQYYVSLTLNDNIDINFKIKELGTGFEQSKLTVTVDGAAVGSENYTMSDETLSCVLKSVEPQSMGDSIRVVVTYDGVQVKSFEYSIRRYCESVFNSEDYSVESELGQLCKAVLNYGKWAEDYYNEANKPGAAASTVNKGYVIEFSQLEIDPEKVLSDEDTVKDGSNVSAASRSLTLDSAFTLNFKLKYSGTLTKDNIKIKNNLDQTVDAADISVEQLTEEDYNYKISIHLGASRLSRSYTLTINNVSESKFKLTYGVYNYCSNIQSMTGEAYTDTLKTLCKAIYNYGEMAKAYTDSLSSK